MEDLGDKVISSPLQLDLQQMEAKNVPKNYLLINITYHLGGILPVLEK